MAIHPDLTAYRAVDALGGTPTTSTDPHERGFSEGYDFALDAACKAVAKPDALTAELLERTLAARDQMGRAADLLEHHGHRELADRMRREVDHHRAAIAKAEGRS